MTPLKLNVFFVIIVSVTAGKQVLFGSTNQATNLYVSHLRCSLSICVLFYDSRHSQDEIYIMVKKDFSLFKKSNVQI